MSTFRDAARVLRDRMGLPFRLAAEILTKRERDLAGTCSPEMRSKIRESALAELLDEHERSRPEVIVRRRIG